jgi:hypothetical protein
LHDIHVAGVSFRGETPLFPASSLRLLAAASYDTTFIGDFRWDLNVS